MSAKYVCLKPEEQTSRVIFNSPHSGRIYDVSFLRKSVLDLKKLRSSEDAFVDEIIKPVSSMGCISLAANFPRCFLDLNRNPEDLDNKLISGFEHKNTNSRILAGLGVIPRVVSDGNPIYESKISMDEVNFRLKNYYFPYHLILKNILQSTKEKFGNTILLDFHSMPRAALKTFSTDKKYLPEIVLGDCYGSSCNSWLMDKVYDFFSSAGFRVEKNIPFAGGFITKNYGKPLKNVQALQIEIDRSIYMDEKDYALHEGFKELNGKIKGVLLLLSKLTNSG